jgi:succinate dehydrogenase / fumarate reductase flavoprotein subunit
VRGILVTEGVRGDGGILLNSEGKRFMFEYISPRFAPETADTVEEAERWVAGDKTARRPPELLTRDEVARAITAEVKAGRGSPHGGALLDIASRRSADFIRRKLPSMYHQFLELAEVDITKEPMEVGPTLHYFMGGIRVDAESQMTRVPGLFACGECAAGLHGANRLGGNSLSDLLVFGARAGLGAKEYLDALPSAPRADDAQIEEAYRAATEPLHREKGENPYLLHEELQDVMGDYVGIVRTGEELARGVEEIAKLRERAAIVRAAGASQYKPGWHEALSVPALVTVAEAVARAAPTRAPSRGAHTRLDCPGEQDECGDRTVLGRKAADGTMDVEVMTRPDPPGELARIARATIEDLAREVTEERKGGPAGATAQGSGARG